MEGIVLLAGALVCAVQAIRSAQLLIATLWLAGASAFIAFFLYLLGAHTIAVIELSVGAGLVTILMVFAITLAGDDDAPAGHVIPRRLAVGLALAIFGLSAALVLPVQPTPVPDTGEGFNAMLWQFRGADAAAQLALIFSGVLGLLALLAVEHEVSSAPVEAASHQESEAIMAASDADEPELEEAQSL